MVALRRNIIVDNSEVEAENIPVLLCKSIEAARDPFWIYRSEQFEDSPRGIRIGLHLVDRVKSKLVSCLVVEIVRLSNFLSLFHRVVAMVREGIGLRQQAGRVEQDLIDAIVDTAVPSELSDIVSEADRVRAAISDVADLALLAESTINEAKSSIVG